MQSENNETNCLFVDYRIRISIKGSDASFYWLKIIEDKDRPIIGILNRQTDRQKK